MNKKRREIPRLKKWRVVIGLVAGVITILVFITPVNKLSDLWGFDSKQSNSGYFDQITDSLNTTCEEINENGGGMLGNFL
ncbi:hypothetical protein COB64_04520 [Candidatus Wolfebacteria bacterium]|nr:MAG: hypothetical protein COB64_04520 [Candidatus Wolfebacteria bacterium]